jgi:hypothetical protein
VKRSKFSPKSITWQSFLVLTLVALMLVQLGALSVALAFQEGGPAASQAVTWEDTKPPPPDDDDGKGDPPPTEGCDWGG